jgi:hypothetical protein
MGNYIVWTEEYEGHYIKVECGDKPATERQILEALKQGKTPLLTLEIPYDFNVKMREDKAPDLKKPADKKSPAPKKVEEETKSETDQDKTEPDQVAGAESNRQV